MEEFYWRKDEDSCSIDDENLDWKHSISVSYIGH